MLELMVFLAFIGSAAAGLYDLKTTEVPDDLPVLMSAFGLFYWFVYALTFGNFYPLFLSLMLGTLLLAFGLLMYRRGQWGEADAWVLAAIAYMSPLYNNEIFMISYIVNFFMVGAAYTIAYAVILGFMHPVWPHFVRDMKGNAKILLAPLAFLLLAVMMQIAGIGAAALLKASVLFLLLLVFWRYGKTIETRVFRRRISTRHLKEGDVVGPLWRGLTKEEIKEIRRKQKYAVVKEGVRFVPVFPITLVVTLIYGNLIFIFV